MREFKYMPCHLVSIVDVHSEMCKSCMSADFFFLPVCDVELPPLRWHPQHNSDTLIQRAGRLRNKKPEEQNTRTKEWGKKET